MVNSRDAIFDYDSLPFVGKVSLRISHRLIVSQLRRGTWLDLLSGYRALLQASQRDNPNIDAFYALDHKLDPALASCRFHIDEMDVDRTLPYRDEMFENITILNGLEHLWHPQEIVAECHRVLKRGGVLQVIVPTWFGKPFLEFLAFRVKNAQAYVEMNDHKMYYDEKTLWPMLVKAGFQPKDVRLKRVKAFCSLYARAEKADSGRGAPEVR